MPPRRQYGRSSYNGPRVIVRYIDATPLAECADPELQWLVNGLVRTGVAAQYPAERPYDLALAIIVHSATLGLAYADKLRWLHYAIPENTFAQSVKRFFGSTGRISEGQLACCRDLAPGETPRRGMASRPAATPPPMPVETLPEPPRYVPQMPDPPRRAEIPAYLHPPLEPYVPPTPAPAPRPTQVRGNPTSDAGWSEATIRALWGAQANTIIAELRGNGIDVKA